MWDMRCAMSSRPGTGSLFGTGIFIRNLLQEDSSLSGNHFDIGCWILKTIKDKKQKTIATGDPPGAEKKGEKVCQEQYHRKS